MRGQGVINSLFLILLCIGAFHSEAAIVVPGSLKTTDVKRNGVVIATAVQLNGAIAPPLAEELEKFFNELDPSRKVILDLNSGGGYNVEGYKIIAVLKKERSRRQIDTLVSNGSRCGSMCVPIYVQGQNRVAGEVSAFMLHGTSTWYSNAIRKEDTEIYIEALHDRGVSKSYIENLKSKGVFLEPADFWTTGKQLVEDKADLVTKLLPALVKYETWAAPIDPNLGSR